MLLAEAGLFGMGAKNKKSRNKTTVTISIGVAERDEQNSTPHQVIKSADKALYRAKRKGRNRVCS
jgi:diguanylate cyclase (GGDEF)-like protein